MRNVRNVNAKFKAMFRFFTGDGIIQIFCTGAVYGKDGFITQINSALHVFLCHSAGSKSHTDAILFYNGICAYFGTACFSEYFYNIGN